jgi:hypothetical protein
MVKLLNSEDVDEFLKEMKETYYGKYMYAADNILSNTLITLSCQKCIFGITGKILFLWHP